MWKGEILYAWLYYGFVLSVFSLGFTVVVSKIWKRRKKSLREKIIRNRFYVENDSAQGILDIVSHIALAHGAADAHGSGGVINVNTAQLCHGLMDHAYLRAVAVGDGQLVVRLN